MSPSPGDAADPLDPASLAVVIARLSGVADEMGAVLRRGAFSPNIKERADCSAAVFDAGGEMLAQAEHIPVHLGSMPASVRAVIDHLGPLGPGEQAIVNDPFAGGTHLNDITVVAPVWRGDELIGWVANRAHHADVGGAAPGSLPADATEIHQEGLRIPPMRLTAEVRSMLLANSRTPGERARRPRRATRGERHRRPSSGVASRSGERGRHRLRRAPVSPCVGGVGRW